MFLHEWEGPKNLDLFPNMWLEGLPSGHFRAVKSGKDSQMGEGAIADLEFFPKISIFCVGFNGGISWT